jgi:hypothetical protein
MNNSDKHQYASYTTSLIHACNWSLMYYTLRDLTNPRLMLLFQLQKFIFIVAGSVNAEPQSIGRFRCQARKQRNRHSVVHTCTIWFHRTRTFHFLNAFTNENDDYTTTTITFVPRINLLLDYRNMLPLTQKPTAVDMICARHVRDQHAATPLENPTSKVSLFHDVRWGT